MRKRLWFFLTRWQRERDLQDELAFHLDQEAEDRRASGVPSDQAVYSAKRDLGNVGQVMEETRAAWGWAFIDTFLHDFRFAVRSLRRNPGFSVLALLILVLGIGAT